jgi:ADP-heptose:LPS heptosyltransferase
MPPADLLIIHQGALGDFILTFPAIIRLKNYYDRIDALCQSRLGKLSQSMQLVNDCHPLEAAHIASLFTDRVDPKAKALLEQYTQIVLFSLSAQFEESINQVAAKPCCRIAPRPPVPKRIHVANFVLENLVNCGLLKREDVELDKIPIPVRNNQPLNLRKILLHPGAGSVRKRWPLSNFIQVEAALTAEGLKPEFILGPAEEDLADTLQQPDRRVHVLEDLVDLKRLLESAGGYIGNDSGASHLAAYSGLPSAVIFGPADPVRWAPVGRSVIIVKSDLQCQPCFEIDEIDCGGSQCLEGIPPQKVIEAFYKVYPDHLKIK